jgi:type IX secretion system PorP/SprF family membrane protein
MRIPLRISTLVLLLLAAWPAAAQQDAQFSQFMFNQLYFNPATAGADGFIRFQLMHRSQWTGYQATGPDDGAPTSQLFSFQMPLNGIRSGVGLYAGIRDGLGPAVNQEVQFSYAYRMPLAGGTLSIGVRPGIYIRTIDFDRLRPVDPGDPLINTGKVNEFQPDLAAGVYYTSPTWYLGLSATHLLSSQYQFDVPTADNALQTTAFANAGYRYYLSESVELNPNVLVKADPAAVSVEGGVLAIVNDRYWAGLHYRSGDAAIAMIGLNFGRNNAFRLGYAFDYVVVGTAAKAPFSHEVLLSYGLPAPKAGRKTPVRTPRFRYE